MSDATPGQDTIAITDRESAVLATVALVAGARRLLHHRDNAHPSAFHAMLRTTPTAIELLPEVDAGAAGDAEPTDAGVHRG